MTVEESAAEDALVQLLGLGMPAAPAKAAASVMVHGMRTVAELVDQRYRDKVEHPLVWAVFHERMARDLPRWRVFARRRHSRKGIRFRNLYEAQQEAACA